MFTRNIQDKILNNSMHSIILLWFGHSLRSQKDVYTGMELTPHGALVLMLMAITSTSTSELLAWRLKETGGLTIKEADILVEYGLDSLKNMGFVKLDKTGERELTDARATRLYGHPGVNWTLTAKGAKRVAALVNSLREADPELVSEVPALLMRENRDAIKRTRSPENKAATQKMKQEVAAATAAAKVKAKKLILK